MSTSIPDYLANELATPPPQIETQIVKELVRKHFGIEGDVKVLVSERDQNFRITDASDERYLFKVANKAEAVEVTDFQTQLLMHLHDTVPHIPVQRVLPTLDGKLMIRHENCTIRLLTYLEGTPLKDVLLTKQIRQMLGNTLATLDLALKDFNHKAASRMLPWDLKLANNLHPLLQFVEYKEDRKLIEYFYDQFNSQVVTLMPELRSQVIYNDLNPGNILIESIDGIDDSLAGVIDFGDAVNSPMICDLAVAASYFLSDTDDMLRGAAELVGAYIQNIPLVSLERRLLPNLIIMRLVMTVLITKWRASRQPENSAYILRHYSHALNMLRKLTDIKPEQIFEQLTGERFE